jgi:hypothetical protein
MKNPFKSKKEKFPTTPVPRTAEEIKKAYFNLRSQAGEYQYQISVYQDEIAKLNAAMRELNYEMDARQKLDQATATEAAKNAAIVKQSEVTNVAQN